jgi:hypothetical protein
MKITIDEIKQALGKVIELICLYEIDQIEIDIDFYLKILSDEWVRIDCLVIEPAMGSMEDDITSLKHSLEEEAFTLVDIERIANILLAIVPTLLGQTILPHKRKEDILSKKIFLERRMKCLKQHLEKLENEYIKINETLSK